MNNFRLCWKNKKLDVGLEKCKGNHKLKKKPYHLQTRKYWKGNWETHNSKKAKIKKKRGLGEKEGGEGEEEQQQQQLKKPSK